MKRMNGIVSMLAVAGAAILLATPAQAANSVFAARVAGKDAPALAKFYESVFGLKEVNRLQIPSGMEIMLGFGETTEAAKANRGPQVFVNQRDADSSTDTIAHVVLHVDDLAATVAAVKAGGGAMQTEPFTFGNTVKIGIARDPAGNLVEMIQTTQGPQR